MSQLDAMSMVQIILTNFLNEKLLKASMAITRRRLNLDNARTNKLSLCLFYIELLTFR